VNIGVYNIKGANPAKQIGCCLENSLYLLYSCGCVCVCVCVHVHACVCDSVCAFMSVYVY